MIISVVNVKGGVGKTTTTVYLGTALEAYGSVRLIDADPQRSLISWAQLAGEDFPETREAPGGHIAAADRTGADWIVIDTPPGDPSTLARAVGFADIVLIPTRPSHGDVTRTLELAEVLHQQQTAATILLTGAQAGTRVLAEVREALAVDLPDGITLYEHAAPFRQHFVTAYGARPRPADLFPYDLIAAELKES